MRSKWSIGVASRHSPTTRLSLRRVSLKSERRFRCKCHAGRGGINLTKSTASRPDHINTSVTQGQDMDEEDRRRYVECLGREIANWNADLNRRLA